MYFKILYVIILFCAVPVENARILGIIHMPSFSHQIVFRPLWKELSLRGHQVTVLTSDPMNDPLLTNLTEIDMHMSYNVWGDYNMLEAIDMPLLFMWYNFTEVNADLIDNQLNHPKVQKIINDPNEHFDLVMIEGMHSAHFAFVERFKCPFITMLSLDATSFVYEEIGHPTHHALYPDYMLPFQGQLSFTERLTSLFYSYFFRHINYHFIIPAQQRLVEKHFGKNYSLVQDIFKNYSMFFLNSNNILHPVRPILPNVVKIGGNTHITKTRPLSKDLQTLLDKSTQGVIYFSLGSNVKSKHISSTILQSIISVFKELPYTILWKFENENLPNKPNNVFISKWFPQQDVLRHPNIKLFITQGGLQSIEEALYTNVPLIGIPVMGDQKSNVIRLASKGLGVLLEYKSITKETFKSAILEVIENPKYRENMKMYAELAVDQSETGIERAIWWTEFVLRHKGASHLRNPAFDLPWYQYHALDIIAFFLIVTLVFIYLIFIMCFRLLKLFKQVILQSKEKQS